jgi:hypothetical protein
MWIRRAIEERLAREAKKARSDSKRLQARQGTTMKRLSLILAATVTLAMCLAAPASAHLKGFNLANDWGALPKPGGQLYRDLGPAKRSGAEILRVQIYSTQMASPRNVRWMTRYLKAIRRAGMKVDLSSTCFSRFPA